MTFTQVSSPVLEISITSPSAGSYINLDNRAGFNVSGNCPVNGETISVTAADGNHSVNAKTACAAGTYSTNLDLTTSTDDSPVTMTLSDGSVTITADRLDTAGNTLTRASVGVTQDTVAPDAPTSVVLSAGTTSPSQSATPTIRVEGTTSADGTPTLTNDLVVSIHADDPYCELPSQKGFGQSTNNLSVDITSSDLTGYDTDYFFYAKATDPAGNSSCSYVYATYKRDIVPPTVTVSSAYNAALTVMKVIPITVAFSESVSGFTQSALTVSGISGGAISNFIDSGAVYSFDLTLPADSTGTFMIDIAAGKVKDLALNENAAAAQYSKTFYTKTPTISGTTPTNNTAPDLTVGNIISGLTARIYTNPACTTEVGAASTTATGTSQIVTPSSPISTSTTFYAAATDADSNKSTCSPGFTLTLDVTAPTIAISGPSIASINNLGTVTYTITYGGADSVTLSSITQTATTGNASCANAVVSGSGNSTRTVTLSSCTGDGTVKINVAAGTAFDLAGNPAPSSGLSSAFTVDNIPPTVSITTPTNGSFINNSNVTSFSFSGACSEPGGQVTVKIDGIATLGTPSCSGTGWSLLGLNMSAYSDGLYTITAHLSDAALNNATPATVSINKDTSAPTIAIGSPSSTLSNYLGMVTYTISYSGANNVTLSDANVTQAVTGTATCGNTAVSGSGNVSRTVTLSNCTGDGTVQINIAAGSASNAAGNLATASGTSAAFTVDNTAPTVAIGSPSISNINSSGSVSYTITYSGANNVTLLASQIHQTAPDAICSNTVISGSGIDSRTVTFSNCTGNSTVQFNVIAGSASDAAGNLATASATSAPFTVDNTAPAITITSPPSSSYVNFFNQTNFAVSGACTDSLSGVVGQAVMLTAAGTNSSSASGTATCDGAAFNAAIDLSNLGEGTLTITASITDAATNSATSSSVSLIKDISPPSAPTLSMSPTGPANNNSPAITGTAETNSTVNVYANASCGDPVVAFGTAAQFTSLGITLSVADNTSNSFSVKAVDQAGNVSPCSASVNYIEDSGPPASTFVINNGTADNALDTTSLNITLKFTATDVSSPITMCISNDSCGSCNLSGYSYEPFDSSNPTKSVTLSGNGLKAFYAKFKDNLGNETPCIKRTILYTSSGDSAVQPRYANGQNWNDYVKIDGSAACDASAGGDTVCEHGGEQRSVTVPETSCAGLSITDALGAFDWYCNDTSGNAVFTSRLKFDKGLAQLIDTANNVFLNNSVTYSINNVSQGSSTPAKWWSNTIAQLAGTSPSASAISVIPLSTPPKIYVLDTGTVAYTGGFNITSDKVAIVIAPNTTLTWSTLSQANLNPSSGQTGGATNKAILAAGIQNYIWIEGTLNGSASSDYGIFLRSVKFANLRRLNISSNVMNGVDLESSNSCRLANVTSTGNTQRGIYFNASNYNLLSGVFAANNGMSGFSFNSSNSNQLSAISSSGNTQHGIHFNSSSSNAGSDLKAANNTLRGIQLDGSTGNKLTKLRVYNNETGTTNGTSGGITLSGSSQNYFQDVITANNHFDGLVLNGSSGNIITNLTSANQGVSAYGFYFYSSSSNNILHNAAIVNNSSTAITDNNSVDANTVSQTALADNGTNTLSGPTQLPYIITPSSLLGDFVVSGITATYSTAFNWFGLGSYQTWGLTSNAKGRCTTGTCGISDWSLKKDVASPAFANPIWNRTGDGAAHNSSYDSSADTYLFPLASNACPGEVNASTSNNVSQIFTCSNTAYFTQSTCTTALGTWTATKTFLKNAVEIIGDGVGNDDGLCESNEHCLYTPNFGAYQGHMATAGAPLNQCAFSNGTITGVTMYGYDSNGY